MKVKELAVSLLVRDKDFIRSYDLLKQENNESQIIDILKEQFCIPKELVRTILPEIIISEKKQVKIKVPTF